MKRIVIHLLALTIIAVAVLPGAAYAESPSACESLAGLKIDNVNLLSATKVAATPNDGTYVPERPWLH